MILCSASSDPRRGGSRAPTVLSATIAPPDSRAPELPSSRAPELPSSRDDIFTLGGHGSPYLSARRTKPPGAGRLSISPAPAAHYTLAMAIFPIVFYVAVAAIVFALLYFVIRAAVLSALAEDRRRQAAAAVAPSYLDADGL